MRSQSGVSPAELRKYLLTRSAGYEHINSYLVNNFSPFRVLNGMIVLLMKSQHSFASLRASHPLSMVRLERAGAGVREKSDATRSPET